MRKDIDKRTNGYKRRMESLRKSADVLVEMVTMVKTAGTTARHLLLDGWFAFPCIIRKIKSPGIETICMLKDMPKVICELHGFPLTLQGLYTSVRKRCGRAKVLAEVLVTIGADEQGIASPAKVVSVRDRNSRKWPARLSADTTD